MNRAIEITAASLLGASTAFFSGCDLDRSALAAGRSSSGDASKAVEDESIDPADIFLHPTPGSAGEDPRLISALHTGASLDKSLAVIHQKFVDLKAAFESKATAEEQKSEDRKAFYESKEAAEEDLKTITRQMLPLVVSARGDCDAILRAARDMKSEFPFAKKGYEAAASLYRERALKFQDEVLRRVEISMADEFSRLAEDVPRREVLTSKFIEQVERGQEFLSEMERSLRDTAAALAIFSAGTDRPPGSPDRRAHQRRLEEFITIVEKYQALFFPSAVPRKPPPGPPPDPKPEQGKPPAPPDAPPKSISRDKSTSATPPPLPAGAVPRDSIKGLSRRVPSSETYHPERRPVIPPATRVSTTRRTARVVLPAPVLHPGVRLGGRTDSMGITSMATMWIRQRSGSEIAGDIYFQTIYGPARRRFRGSIRDDGTIVLRGDRVEGNILPSPCFYQGRVTGGSIEGWWSCGTVTGSFRFSP